MLTFCHKVYGENVLINTIQVCEENITYQSTTQKILWRSPLISLLLEYILQYHTLPLLQFLKHCSSEDSLVHFRMPKHPNTQEQ